VNRQLVAARRLYGRPDQVRSPGVYLYRPERRTVRKVLQRRLSREEEYDRAALPLRSSGVQISARRIWTARGIAMGADVLQWILFPLFLGGALEPATAIVDAVVAAVMIWLCGWHMAFVPTAAVKLLPVADLFPTWTAAAFFVTRKRK